MIFGRFLKLVRDSVSLVPTLQYVTVYFLSVLKGGLSVLKGGLLLHSIEPQKIFLDHPSSVNTRTGVRRIFPFWSKTKALKRNYKLSSNAKVIQHRLVSPPISVGEHLKKMSKIQLKRKPFLRQL